MWVLGDLKDQLGIKHRRNRRKGDAEHAPMFEADYHEQSISEVESIDLPYDAVPDARGTYVPAGTQSPPDAARAYSDAPKDKSPSRVDVNLGYVAKEGDVWDTETPIGREPPISRASYYSASDLPPPSPLAESNIYSPTSSQSVAMTSVTTNPVTQDFRSSQSLLPSHDSLSPHHTSTHSPRANMTPPRSPHNYPGAAAYPGEYEMRVRSPTRSPQPDHAPSEFSHFTQQSESSFFTARDASSSDYHGAVVGRSRDEDTATITARSKGEPGGHDPWRESISSQATDLTSSPHAL